VAWPVSEAVAFENAAQHVGQVDRADAVADAEARELHALGELDDLLDSGPAVVAFRLDLAGHLGEASDEGVLVFFRADAHGFLVDLGGAPAGATHVFLAIAARPDGGRAVGTSGILILHCFSPWPVGGLAGPNDTPFIAKGYNGHVGSAFLGCIFGLLAVGFH